MWDAQKPRDSNSVETVKRSDLPTLMFIDSLYN